MERILAHLDLVILAVLVLGFVVVGVLAAHKTDYQDLENHIIHYLKLNGDYQGKMLNQLDNGLKNDFESFKKDEGDRYLAVVDRLEKLEEEVNFGLEKIRTDNNEKLERMRATVEEKLQDTLEKRISKSFEVVNAQLQQVYQGIGEMKNLATDVGGLKKILGNVKTRGILGEVQLAAKDSGDKEKIEAAYKDLENVVVSMAKDIHEKYIEEPHTTNFGIMFLASEGLYAEVVSRGLMQKLQRTYQITMAGPSTMAAFLNSLQMGFRTLAIEKRSSEVWKLLGAVKAEFGKFEDGLKKMKRNIETTNNEIDELMGKRTRAINRKLRDVETIDFKQAEEKLEIEESSDE